MSVPDATTIYYIRHGENPANITREFSYRKVDYPLTARGVEQARQTAEHLRSRPIAAVYASPLKRAAQTAEIVAAPIGLPVLLREAFREVNVGRLEDEPPSDENWAFHDRIFDAWLGGDPSVRFPGGECQLDLLRRMRAGLGEIVTSHPGREVVVVAHGGILWATIGALCPNARQAKFTSFPNCAITELALVRDGDGLSGEMRGWAFCAHLE
jgi:broad specificity phosphatase PhoE